LFERTEREVGVQGYRHRYGVRSTQSDRHQRSVYFEIMSLAPA
jgi:hypothetical protein